MRFRGPQALNDKTDDASKPSTKSAIAISESLAVAIGVDGTSANTVRGWLNGFRKRVVTKIDEIKREIVEPRAVPPAPAGANSIDEARNHQRQAGALWRKAFFEGMEHVLQETEKIYQQKVLPSQPDKPGASSKDTVSLKTLAGAIESAGKEWKLSAKRTRNFLNVLSNWSKAEIERQITLYSLKHRTNYDPVQLAFAVSTY